MSELPDRAPAGVVVAMDGPSGSGKSSTSRGVAQKLGLRYLDTGAQFRAMTVWMLRHGGDVSDPEAVAARAGEPHLVSGTDPAAPTITVEPTSEQSIRDAVQKMSSLDFLLEPPLALPMEPPL